MTILLVSILLHYDASKLFLHTVILLCITTSPWDLMLLNTSRTCWIVLLFSYLQSMASAQVAEQQPMIIPNVKGVVVLDGKFDDLQWQQAKTFNLEYVVSPYENTEPPVRTEVKIFENDDTLFIGFTAFDPDPGAIRSFYRDRDNVWNDDLVGFKLDTYNDSRLAYQFFVNPLGIQADSIQNEMSGKESDSWNAIWQSAGVITKQGYQVEMAIPLRILNFKEGQKNKIWGAEFARFYPRQERLRISNLPTDRNNSCNLCQLSEISGFEQAEQGQNLALVPTLVVARDRDREPESSLAWDYSDRQEVGLDVSWGITPEVSLQATLNPDFSQVESDVAQLSVNNNNALFFGERRPFFLENADYFSTNINLVHTRNINAPDYGVKVTGRKAQHSVGVFTANDQTTTFIVPGNLGSSVAELESKSSNLALRYRYDFSRDLSMGVVNTMRESDNYHNYVYGADTKYQLSSKDTIKVQWVGSQTRYPDELVEEFDGESALRVQQDDAISGNALRINYRHNQEKFFIRADHDRYSENFRADLGFQNKVDRNTTILGGAYRWYQQDSWWNRIEVFGDWDISHNSAGQLLERESEIATSIRGRWQSYVELGVRTRDRVGLRQNDATLEVKNNTSLFTENSVKFFMQIRPSKSLFFNTFVRYGDQIDFTNNRLGKQLEVNPRINLSVGKHLQFNLLHKYTNLDVDGQRLFTANLTDARLTYQFDQQQFLRLIMLYSDVERNLENYLVKDNLHNRDSSLGVQLLYSYKLNPLTKFFVGLSDFGFQDDVVIRRQSSEQSIFMKFSYAWLN